VTHADDCHERSASQPCDEGCRNKDADDGEKHEIQESIAIGRFMKNVGFEPPRNCDDDAD
jgi:hypothetical protein